jgi:hypothetical protein
MAVTPVAAVLTKRKALNWLQHNPSALGPELRFLVQQLLQTLAQIRGNPDLLFVPLDNSGTTDQVVGDAPLKLYALGLKGGSAGGDYRSADHASSANTPTTTIPLAVGEIAFYSTPAGKSFANGLTIDFSQANAGSGFAIIGAP